MRRRFERRRPPILEVISAWDDGPPPALPDEGPDDGRTIRWGAGALDGVVARDADSAREPVDSPYGRYAPVQDPQGGTFVLIRANT